MSKIGEQNRATNGQMMTIVDYRNSYDIDVKFEDGCIVKNKAYQSFKKGSIRNPSLTKDTPKQSNLKTHNKIGESKIANNGQKMTIIEYFAADNITVEFEDGTIVKNRAYQSFKNGSIKNPTTKANFDATLQKMTNKRVGEKSMSSCGIGMTIIAYRSAKDIDVKFEDGTVVQNVWYNRFKSGNVKHPIAGKDGIRLGATNTNKDNRKMKIVEYINSNNVIVEFDDGVRLKTSYKAFKDGIAKHPADGSCRHIGEIVTAKNGQKATLKEWKSNRNIVVEFEDGTVINTSYRYFKEGKIGNPNYTLNDRCREKRIGETSISTNGQKITIIDYIKANDIKVQFEDGVIVEHAHYNSFKNGTIHNPKMPLIKKGNNSKIRMGETKKANNGMSMTIIAYRKSNDIDVKFEDGTVVTNRNYQDFKSGEIRNPNVSLSSYSKKYNK